MPFHKQNANENQNKNILYTQFKVSFISPKRTHAHKPSDFRNELLSICSLIVWHVWRASLCFDLVWFVWVSFCATLNRVVMLQQQQQKLLEKQHTFRFNFILLYTICNGTNKHLARKGCVDQKTQLRIIKKKTTTKTNSFRSSPYHLHSTENSSAFTK